MVSESGCDVDFETVLDFDIWWKNDWDIQNQRQHIIMFALAKVAKFKLNTLLYVDFPWSNYTRIIWMCCVGNAQETLRKYRSAADPGEIETPASSTVETPPSMTKKTIQQYVAHIMLQADGLNNC